MTGRILLNADDYALTPGVSQAIRMLAAAARITSTSAIVTFPGWHAEAAALKPLRDVIAIGLHFNLTEGKPLGDAAALAGGGTMPGIKARIVAAYAGRLGTRAVADEIARQLDAFEAGMGAPPDFIDGHEHVHVLPGIRGALLDILKSRYAGRAMLIRDPSPSSAHDLKALTLRALSRNMCRDIEQAGFLSNDRFGGLTHFGASNAAVAQDFADAAEIEGWRPLVMCHPGFPDSRHPEHLDARRQLEFEALMAADCVLALNAWRPIRTADGSIDWPHAKRTKLA